MKKIWYMLFGIAITVLLFSGCSTNKTEQEEDTETGLDKLENFLSGEDAPDIECIYGEQEAYPELAEFLASYYEIPAEQRQQTRYYYNYMDLNEDGSDEIFAIVISEELEESDGKPVLLLLTKENGTFLVLEDFGRVHTPIKIRKTKTNNWYDIELHVYGRGMEDGYLICRYNPEGGYQTEDNEFLEEIDEPVAAVQILSNNLIDDMDNERYLTLE